MPIIDTSLTLENLEKSKAYILELVENPHAGHRMKIDLQHRLDRVNDLIFELEKENESKNNDLTFSFSRLIPPPVPTFYGGEVSNPRKPKRRTTAKRKRKQQKRSRKNNR